MNPEFQALGKALIFVGVLIAGTGAFLLLVPKAPWIGRLPGDLVIERERLTVYIPLTTCLLVSAVLSLLVWLVSRFR